MVLGLCDRFHCLPSALDDEDAGILRLVQMVQMGNPDKESGELEEGDE